MNKSMKPFPLILCLVALSCSNVDKGNSETIATRDPQVTLQLDYREDGTLQTVRISSKDSSQVARLDLDREHRLFGFAGIRDRSLRNAVEFFENGRPAGLRNVDAHGTGHAVYYHENGAIRSEGWLVKEKWIGVKREYDSTGALIRVDTIGSVNMEHPGFPVR
jgi:hypothetical protein